MTVAAWILAIATVALAIEGGAALRGWFAHLQLGRRKQELNAIKRDITLLRHAMWMDVATAGQGTRTEVDEKVRRMLQLDGWAPDVALMEQAGYFNIRRLHGDVPGVSEE
jgi:hypothetical protein